MAHSNKDIVEVAATAVLMTETTDTTNGAVVRANTVVVGVAVVKGGNGQKMGNH